MARDPQPQMVEVITEPKGTLHFGPPKTSAGRRMVELAPVRGRRPGRADGGAGLAGGAGVRRAARWALRVTLFRRRFWLPATRAAGLEGLRIHDPRHTVVALWIAAGANPKEDLTLHERLDAIWSTSRGRS
jgi:integrase